MSKQEETAIEECLKGIARATSGADAKAWADAYGTLHFVIEKRKEMEEKADIEAQMANIKNVMGKIGTIGGSHG